jgi:hypothetical protein
MRSVVVWGGCIFIQVHAPLSKTAASAICGLFIVKPNALATLQCKHYYYINASMRLARASSARFFMRLMAGCSHPWPISRSHLCIATLGSWHLAGSPNQ